MSKEVLIVDDDRSLASSLERAVSGEGYAATVVHDGESALQRIRTSRPGLVLLDLLIPNKDGRAVLASLRGRQDTEDLPVVVMTGIFRGRQHAVEMEKAGAQAFLEKPFRRSDLLPLLRRHLGRPLKHTGQTAVRLDPGEPVALVEHPVAKVLWEAMSRRLSGALIFEAGKRRKTLVFEAGRPVQIGSNVARETLGNRLLAAGRIDSRALQESIARARAGEGKQGEILVTLGAVSQNEVDRALVSQSEEKLLELFSWTDGEVVHRPDVTQVARASSLEAWTPREVILRGIQLMSSKRVERILAPYWDQRIRVVEGELSDAEASVPAVAAALSSLKVQRLGSVGSVASDHAPAVYGLYLVGAIGFESADGAVSPSSGAGLANGGELRERIAAQESQTHFEVLDLAQDASAEAVRAAFLKLAKRFHPDRYVGEGDELRELAADVFARISRAHEVLSDSHARRDYQQALARGGEEGERGVAQMLTAEAQFQKGETHFRKREYIEALEQFHWALELNPDEGEFHAYYGWTYFLAKREDDKARSVAEEHLERAQRLSPNSATGYYLAGLLRKTCGDLQAAERMFKKTLEVSPNHVEANRELRLLNMRRDRSEGGRGLFGLGRKK